MFIRFNLNEEFLGAEFLWPLGLLKKRASRSTRMLKILPENNMNIVQIVY